jgi:trehalose 6-phosphate phosphatase
VGAPLDHLRSARASAGVFLDFDGTLSDIVARPELARPVDGATEAVTDLVRTFAFVAVVSGRPVAQIRELVPVGGLEVFGLYGLEPRAEDIEAIGRARPEVEEIAATVDGAWVEDKGLSLAVHYRQAPDQEAAARTLSPDLERAALRTGLLLFPGKMVIELAPRATPGKGSIILREVRSRRLSACLYAGDDQADLGAFAALDELRDEGVFAVKVAVRSSETPDTLTGAADVTVDGPLELVRWLRTIAA